MKAKYLSEILRVLNYIRSQYAKYELPTDQELSEKQRIFQENQ